MGGIGGIVSLAPLLIRHPIGIVILLLLLAGSYLMSRFGTEGADAPRATETRTTGGPASKEDREKHFVAFVLDDAQKNWQEIFSEQGRQYENAKLVLFSDATSTACGYGQAATGPFYCPADERVYIDLSFYDELARRFGAAGDFAQAYVIAHEIGHHVQHQLGTTSAVQRRAQRQGESSASVRLELQADCYAGIWAHSTDTRGLLEQGDIDEALTAAAAIGDDRLQRRSGGVVTPESFTHGTSEQRARWFKTGYQTGRLDACDTFRTPNL